jgi:2-polyprenyl-3-methyl-5-hydroxy-6-metoxy-1,4-benzoquinol methylase
MLSIFFKRDNAYFSEARHDLISLVSGTGCTILEVGCGTGATAEALRLQGKANKLVGIEIDPEMAHIAHKRFDLIVCGDIEEIKIPDQYGKYDYIICGDVLEHLRDPWNVINKLKAQLKDDGFIIASIPNIRFWRIIHDLVLRGNWIYRNEGILDISHLRFFTKKSMITMFKKADLKIITMKPYYLGRKTYLFNKITFSLFLDFLTTRYIIKAKNIKGKRQ